MHRHQPWPAPSESPPPLMNIVLFSFAAGIGYWASRPLLRVARVQAFYQRHFQESRRERLLLASTGFFLTFALTRVIAHLTRAGIGPFHDLIVRGTHVHHMVGGI